MRQLKWLSLLISALLLCSCSGFAAETDAAENLHPLTDSIVFKDEDMDSAYDAAEAVQITLNGDSAECASGYVEISENTVTVTKGGTYAVSGSLSGMIIIHADKQDTVRIVLNGANISSPDSAAIYVRCAKKAIITCAEGSENSLSNGGEYIDIDDSNIDSVIFSKDDLAINGHGLLAIDAKEGHGIVSKDSLRITDANISITSAAHAISAKDDIGINGGKYSLTSGKDGIHAENKDDSSLGNLLVCGGEFRITSDGDGISAENMLQIDGGDFSVLSGGGHENVPARSDDFMRFRSTESVEDSGISAKALKSGAGMYINGGTFDLDSSDDALHSDTNLRISTGGFSIQSGDDALHAESNLSIYGGTIDIASSYEGLEAQTIDVHGGKIALFASDDGMNAAGGSDGSGMGTGFDRNNPFSSDPDAYICIHGGQITVRCVGDGIDSNGEIRISGGKTIVMGPTSGGNGSLDCGTGAYIDGGIFCALGSAQMAEPFSEESAQCSLIVSSSGAKGDVITLTDASGNALFETTAENSFDCVIMSLPEFAIGKSYQLAAGENSMDILFESQLYSTLASSGFGGMMGRGGRMQNPMQRHGERNGMNPPENLTPPDGTQMPEGMVPPDGMTPPDGMAFPDGMNFREKPSMP